MRKSEILISMVAGENSINPGLWMEDKKFGAKDKKLMKDKLEFRIVKDKHEKGGNKN